MATTWATIPPSAADPKPAIVTTTAPPYTNMRVRLGTAPRYLGRVRRPFVLMLLVALPAGCGGGDKASEPLPKAEPSIKLTSPAFRDGGSIPARFTCDGEGVSPPLRWSSTPGSARELALVVEDQDAGRFVHWTVLGIPAEADGMAENRVPVGASETENSFGKPGWGGPCPPKGDDPHHYVFALYATNAPLALAEDASPDDVRAALSDHAIARGTLTALSAR
jgi:Raf kinase inhibitor-like YbhB/YbcL family protein